MTTVPTSSAMDAQKKLHGLKSVDMAVETQVSDFTDFVNTERRKLKIDPMVASPKIINI